MLDEKERRLARLFTACVLGRWALVDAQRRSAPPGEPDRAWREAVLMLHLFGGMPRQVESYEVLDAAGGLGELEPGEAEAAGDRLTEGRELFKLVYAEKAAAVEARLYAFHPDFGAYILGHAYGRVMARPGLSARCRELLAIGALAALGQDRQLASHARGSIRAGATAEEAAEALELVADLIEPERLNSARVVLARFAVP